MKSLVIGAGQIGQALYEIFSLRHTCLIRDVEAFVCPDVDVLHVAYPYSENFLDATQAYIQEYRPKLTIVHSSVPIGTTRKLGDGVVHSPERGRYPNLAFEMMQFPKFIGGVSVEDVKAAAKFFYDCEWPTVLIDNPDKTEALKLISNAHLGLEIAWRQEVDRILEGQTAEYDVWEDTYNKGHQWLGHRQLIRPRLGPMPIGGHCVLPCLEMLADRFKSLAFEFVRRSNAERIHEEESWSHSRPRETAGAR